MNQALLAHQPTAVWKHFEALNAVPRPSKKEERIIAFMKDFGQSLGLETIVDKTGNVIIRKPATAGREDRPGVVLQGHLDMVHQKNSDTDFDFDTRGIESYIDDDGWLKAKGTTLGADNGVGVASIMAVLSSDDLEHGPLEGLFTIDEETGMTGAFKLEPGILQGSILLNTDTEDEGELCIGCAGGIDTTVELEYEEVPPTGNSALKISLTGLKGGHSGCEIHLGRGNANKIMNRLLWRATETGFQIANMQGGSLRNAIPRESFATVVVNVAKDVATDVATVDSFKRLIQQQFEIVQAELALTEPDLNVTVEPTDVPAKVLNGTSQQNLLNAIYAAPCGVYRMSDGVPGLVETSTNLAKIQIGSGQANVQFLTRSSVQSAKVDLSNMISATFVLAGATVEHTGSYPGWKPNPESKILDLMRDVYKTQFGNAPEVNAVHAGLECGIIGSHYPGMDMISFGPTIKNPHSPDEKCDIKSVEKYWQYLLAILKRVAGVK